MLLLALGVACLGGGLWITQRHNETLAATTMQHNATVHKCQQHVAAYQQHIADLTATQQQNIVKLEAAQVDLTATQQQLEAAQAELAAAQQQHSAELAAAQAELAALQHSPVAVATSRSGVRWANTDNCGGPTPECVGQINHGCGPRHNNIDCVQGLFCNGQWCHEGCESTPMRTGNEIGRVEGLCDYLPCEISWLFDEGSPENSCTEDRYSCSLEDGPCTEGMSIERMLLRPTVPTPANQPYFADPDTFFDTEIQQMPAQRVDLIEQDLDAGAPQQLLSSHRCANGDLFTAHSESEELMSKSCTLKNVGMRADGTILYVVDDLNTTPVPTFEHSTFIWTDTNRAEPSKVRVNVEVVEVGSTAFDGMIVNPVLLVWHTHWINFGHFHNEVVSSASLSHLLSLCQSFSDSHADSLILMLIL